MPSQPAGRACRHFKMKFCFKHYAIIPSPSCLKPFFKLNTKWQFKNMLDAFSFICPKVVFKEKLLGVLTLPSF